MSSGVSNMGVSEKLSVIVPHYCSVPVLTLFSAFLPVEPVVLEPVVPEEPLLASPPRHEPELPLLEKVSPPDNKCEATTSQPMSPTQWSTEASPRQEKPVIETKSTATEAGTSMGVSVTERGIGTERESVGVGTGAVTIIRAPMEDKGIQTLDPAELERILSGGTSTSPTLTDKAVQADKPAPTRSVCSVQVGESDDEAVYKELPVRPPMSPVREKAGECQEPDCVLVSDSTSPQPSHKPEHNNNKSPSTPDVIEIDSTDEAGDAHPSQDSTTASRHPTRKPRTLTFTKLHPDKLARHDSGGSKSDVLNLSTSTSDSSYCIVDGEEPIAHVSVIKHTPDGAEDQDSLRDSTIVCEEPDTIAPTAAVETPPRRPPTKGKRGRPKKVKSQSPDNSAKRKKSAEKPEDIPEDIKSDNCGDCESLQSESRERKSKRGRHKSQESHTSEPELVILSDDGEQSDDSKPSKVNRYEGRVRKKKKLDYNDESPERGAKCDSCGGHGDCSVCQDPITATISAVIEAAMEGDSTRDIQPPPKKRGRHAKRPPPVEPPEIVSSSSDESEEEVTIIEDPDDQLDTTADSAIEIDVSDTTLGIEGHLVSDYEPLPELQQKKRKRRRERRKDALDLIPKKRRKKKKIISKR